MFGKKMITLAVAGVATVSACGGAGCTHGNDTGMPEMPEDFDMASLEKMFAEMFGPDFDMSKLMEGAGMEDDEQLDFATPTTAPAPTPSTECEPELMHMDSSDSDDDMFVSADEGFSPVESFIPGFTPAQAVCNKMSYPLSFARTQACGFTSMEDGCTPFEGFTCMEDKDVTPMVDSLDELDDSNDVDSMDQTEEPQMMCDAGMCCGMEMCGLEEPSTVSAAFNSTNADMCGAGMCGMEEPTQSAEDMFNNTNTCGDGFAGAMCGLQKNITNMFGSFSNNSTEVDNNDSFESDL